MIELHNKVLDRTIKVERLMGSYLGILDGPTLIFVAGIHGNEASGVFALEKVLSDLEAANHPVRGNIYAISGNLSALSQGVRYSEEDLNRIWTKERMLQLDKAKQNGFSPETKEQIEIHSLIEEILETENGPFYFFDLHTTSGATVPFLTVNDSLLNRKYTRQYPLPIVLGIEEFLDGPILSYINELGYVAFGYEGGQHDDPQAYHNHVSFVYLSLYYTGCLTMEEARVSEHLEHFAKQNHLKPKFFEITEHFPLEDSIAFDMINGFVNFQLIKKRTELAIYNGHTIHAPRNGLIFMPLYQGKGSDGFFMIRRIPRLFLRWSIVLRKIYFDRLLVLLPGVSWAAKDRSTLRVNLRVARFLAKPIFHLLGYRSKKTDATHLVVKNREANSRTVEYKNEPWYKR